MQLSEFTVWSSGIGYTACLNQEKISEDPEGINIGDLSFHQPSKIPSGYIPFLQYNKPEGDLRDREASLLTLWNRDFIEQNCLNVDFIKCLIHRNENGRISIRYLFYKSMREIFEHFQDLPDDMIDIVYFSTTNCRFVILDDKGSLWTMRFPGKIDEPAVLLKIPCNTKIYRLNAWNDGFSVIAYDENDIAILISKISLDDNNVINARFDIFNREPILNIVEYVILFTSGLLKGDKVSAKNVRSFRLVTHMITVNRAINNEEDQEDSDGEGDQEDADDEDNSEEHEFKFLYLIDHSGALWVAGCHDFSEVKSHRFLSNNIDSFDEPRVPTIKSSRNR